VLSFAPAPPASPPSTPQPDTSDSTLHPPSLGPRKSSGSHLSLSSLSTKVPALKKQLFDRSRTPSPEPALTALPAPPKPRRLVLVLVGLDPHRKLWTTSQRPGESVVQYHLLNGCPAVVVPAKVGAPLLAWLGLTLEQLWKVQLPPPEGSVDLAAVAAAAQGGLADEEAERSFAGVVSVLFEYLDLCVDWGRVVVPEGEGASEEEKKGKVKEAVMLLVAAAIRSKDSKQVQKEVDKERAGLAMWRIP
jgi:hypothetical protein